MRLGQLARKLEIRPAEIVEFLALKGIAIEENVNTRLEDDQVVTILRHYNPEHLNEVVLEDDKKESEVLEPPSESEPVLPQLQLNGDDEGHEVVGEKPEVIKAPKIELTGLKIIGKIELPEPKKKPETTAPPAETPTAEPYPVKPAQKVNPFGRNMQRSEHRPRKNPVALQREREASEEKKKRAEQAEREKDRKTRNYYKKVKLSPPTKAVRLVDEPVMQMSAHELEEPPRTWFGRFIKWLTTA